MSKLPPRELLLVVKDLQHTRPGPGLTQILGRVSVLVPLLAWNVSTWWRHEWGFYLLSATLVGFWYASILMTTHDAVHHTFTGRPWLDELWGRLVSWPVLWVHASFTRIHHLHHRMNGIDLDDPERVDPTAAEIAEAGPMRRWIYRHRMVWEMGVLGAAGLIVETLVHAWQNRRYVPEFPRLMVQDIVGASLSFTAIHAAGYWMAETMTPGRGPEMVVGSVLTWVFIERITGAAMYLRKHLEHSGHWVKGDNFFETQFLSCRNILTSEVTGWFFSRLNYHSVHHAFPLIPFYALREAHERIEATYGKLPTSQGYVNAFVEVVRASNKR